MSKAKLGLFALPTTHCPPSAAHLLALAILVAGIIGCSGQRQASHPTMASMGGAAVSSSPQFAQQSVLPSGAVAKSSPWNAVTGMWTNNPVNASVQKAWNGMTQPAGPPAAGYQSPASTVTIDALALSNQLQAPTAALYTSMGQLAEKYGNIDQARLHYQKALETTPNDTGALLAYGHLEDRQERLDEALKLYSLAAQSNPSDATAQNDLGLCLARKDDMPAAATALSRAVELQPQRKLYRNNLATVLIKLDRTDEALAQLTAVHPPAIAHYNMGYLLQKYGQETQAVEHFATASRLDPSMDAAQSWLAKLQPMNGTSLVAESKEHQSLPANMPQQEQATVVSAQSGASRLPVIVGPVVASSPVQPVVPMPQVKPVVVYPVQSLPVQQPTPPVPQYDPSYPTFPPQPAVNSGPFRLPAANTSPRQAVAPVEPSQSSWPLHQPSEVPNTNLGASAAQPPVPTVPATVTNVYVNRPQPLPPVQQASTSGTIRR